jgi:CheY-like chemotaxis protein
MSVIWIIDDDDIFQFITRKSIEKIDKNRNIITFSNGQEAIKSINQTQEIPDVILLDINMPIMDGWEFLNKYEGLGNSNDKNTHIYMVSSSIDSKDLDKAQNSIHITDYITKPIDENKMIEILSNRN